MAGRMVGTALGGRAGSMLGAMEGAGKMVEDEELREAMAERGLGTPATRAQIIENLISEEYVHRIGRTGRAGREGKAITFVCERDLMEFDVLLRAYGDHLVKEELDLYG